MPVQGIARVGHKAPDFACEAIVDGELSNISLDEYMKRKRWVILLFIPAAFSYLCPQEILAFHNTIDEFHDRDCELVFVSTDSKYSLLQWQSLPRSHGGLGKVKVTIASDQTHRMSRDYGVLIEDKGLDLRGMFIIDTQGIVQQMTINTIAVGRSVLEALRLLEAIKIVAEKGVLCPANWKPGDKTMTWTGEYSADDTDEAMAKEMEHVHVKNLDNNTSQPFNLAMPAHIEAKRNPGSPVSMIKGSNQPAGHSRSSSSSANNSKRNSAAVNTLNKHVTLEFSDPLTDPQGKEGNHSFVPLSELNGEQDRGNTSPTSNMQKGIDVLKRMSSGWSTPMRSPGLSGPSPIREASSQGGTSTPARIGYFE